MELVILKHRPLVVNYIRTQIHNLDFFNILGPNEKPKDLLVFVYFHTTPSLSGSPFLFHKVGTYVCTYALPVRKLYRKHQPTIFPILRELPNIVFFNNYVLTYLKVAFKVQLNKGYLSFMGKQRRLSQSVGF
jgi:hypothetical protein